MTKNKLHFLPVDYITLAYMLVTAIYMLFGWNTLSDIGEHLLTRTVIATIIVILSRFDTKQINRNSFYKFVRNFYPLLLLGYFYKETGYLNNIIFDFFDPWFTYAEQSLWGLQPSIEFSKLFPQKWFSELMNFSYFFYYLLTIGLSLTIWFTRRSKLQEVIFVIFTSFIIYYLFFAIFPVKGPQFYFTGTDAQAVTSYLFSHFVKLAQNIGETETGAFPSSHVGMSIVFLIISWKYSRNIFWMILTPVILLWFATIYIKAHYLIDVIGGFISAPIVYWLSEKLYFKIEDKSRQIK
jgi:membrane-associated phospholipid phosphatase